MGEMELKKIFKVIKNVGLGLIALFAIGFISGYVISSTDIVVPTSRYSGILGMAIIFIGVYLGAFLSIVIHEGGHLVFGLLTGYKFISFRIGRFILIKANGNYKIRVYNILGTGGQCLLDPPDLDAENNFSYKLYNLGGGIMNILVFIISIVYIILGGARFGIAIYLFGILNLFMGLLNLIPFTKTINNDGKNQVLLRDESTRLYFWKSLKINKNLTEGISMADMDRFLFEYKEADKNSALKDGVIIANVNYNMNRGEYSLVREEIEKLLVREDLIDLYKKELICDLMFLEVLDMNKYAVKKLMTKDVKKYIKLTGKYYIQRKRLMYGVYLLIEDDFDKAAEELSAFNKLAKSYPYQVEIEVERKYIDEINEIYENTHQ